MIPKECKRLAEVDFPIAVVSKHSAREKSIRHGHPSTLHLWWARRPLAACRAMLLGLLLPDPCDKHCPADFKKTARALLTKVPGRPGAKDIDLRHGILKFIGDFANWDLASNPVYLEVSRGLVKAAHGDEAPLVVDPFAGGGSIPLEALRLGCDAFASDLNPVACLIEKVMLEDIPRHGPKLAEELRRVGAEIKKAAELELTEFYPPDADGAKPIAYLWARTVQCESPNCGAEIPLMRSFWLCKKPKRRRALRHKVIRTAGSTPRVELEIFEPKKEQEVSPGTVTRAKATCLCCGTVLPPDRVRAQLSVQRGGADTTFDLTGNRTGGARLLAVVTLHPGEQGRHYRLSTVDDYKDVWRAQMCLTSILAKWDHDGKKGLCPVPDEPTPAGGGVGAGRAFSVQKYGMMVFGDLFTVRQKLALVTIKELTNVNTTNSEIVDIMALVFNRAANAGSSLCRWHVSGEKHEGVYSRQTLPIVWDFSECNPLSTATGGYTGALDWVASVIEEWATSPIGQVQQSDSTNATLPAESVDAWFTDPPYYDAVPYADLSDFFFVWLKRTTANRRLLKDPYDNDNLLTPKIQEAVQDEIKLFNGQPKNKVFFEQIMSKAFAEGRRILKDDGVGSVVFAHKTTEGWEALLSGMINGGWTITGSWPIATEMSSRLRAQESAALATSVHLVCRPRPEDAPVGDWGDVLRELPNRVGDWMERLQDEGVRGADLVFACIGPALEIFSRYSKVETAEGREVKLAEYLEKVWETVGREALGQVLGTAEAKARNGAAGAVEEDARLTALFLWTLQSTNGDSSDGTVAETEDDAEDADDEDTPKAKAKGFSLVYDVVRRFAQPLGIDLTKWEGRTIEIKKGVVRLLSISEWAKQLFGEESAQVVADRLEKSRGDIGQLTLFPELEAAPVIKARGRRAKVVIDLKDDTHVDKHGATTLDRVHAAMLLQSSGQTNALRALLKAEQDRGQDFVRLSNALSALYPKGSEEKRLLDAMLLAVPR
jgi:putative DNA methylase